MQNYIIALATFCTSQCQDGVEFEVLNADTEDVRAFEDPLI